MNKNVFLGVFFLLFGLSILLNAFFGFHLPVFRTLFALIFIYLGIQFFFGAFTEAPQVFKFSGNSACFSSIYLSPQNEDDLQDSSILFGKAVIDLSSIKSLTRSSTMRIHTLFGQTEVLLSRDTSVAIHSSAAFAETKMPNENMVAFGSLHYRADFDQHLPCINIFGSVAFGALRFRFKD